VDKAREEVAKKLGFSAYAVSSDMNDPMVKAIHGLIDHSANTDQRMEWVIAELKRLGGAPGKPTRSRTIIRSGLVEQNGGLSNPWK
jgi:hypothetical protein